LFAIDSAGRRVPTANQVVGLSVDGPAKLLGVGNGDPTCHEPDKGSSRTLFRGVAQAIIQTTRTAGEIRLTASSPGLQPGVMTLRSEAKVAPPAVPVERVRRFISDWRISPTMRDRPDLSSQQLLDHDVNSWDRVDPAQRHQPVWPEGGGFVIYRATFTPPKLLQARGGRIVFHELRGEIEVFLNGAPVAATDITESPGFAFTPTAEKVTVLVLVRATAAPAGILQAVELLEGPT
jgi:beta-galactosidase